MLIDLPHISDALSPQQPGLVCEAVLLVSNQQQHLRGNVPAQIGANPKLSRNHPKSSIYMAPELTSERQSSNVRFSDLFDALQN